MNQRDLHENGDESPKDLMIRIFRENKRREFLWETLAAEVLSIISPTMDWPKKMKTAMKRTVEDLFNEVRQKMEETKEGVFCPTWAEGGRWKIIGQTLKDLEEDSQDVIEELLRRERRAAAYHKALDRGKEAAIAQGILDRHVIDKELDEGNDEEDEEDEETS